MNNDRKNVLAFFAHPDDETFRPGGTLAILARRGVRVQVLTATRGQSGSCGEYFVRAAVRAGLDFFSEWRSHDNECN